MSSHYRRIHETYLVVASAAIMLGISMAHAKGPGRSVGTGFIEAPGARAAALGEAFSAVADDVTAMAYNPASLATLQTGQASFLYYDETDGGSFGQVFAGGWLKKTGWGLSAGYYSSGEVDVIDESSRRMMVAQKDLSLLAGFSKPIGRLSLGISGKYLHSQLLDDKASAAALDGGALLSAMPKLNLGFSLQNIGTGLRYVDNEHPLPRMARVGLAMGPFTSDFLSMLVLADVPYAMNEHRFFPGLGLEIQTGALRLRGGSRSDGATQQYSMGFGLLAGAANVDYSFNFRHSVETAHRISIRFNIGKKEAPPSAPEPVREPSIIIDIHDAHDAFDVPRDKRNSEKGQGLP
jgi:hypothetical protein